MLRLGCTSFGGPVAHIGYLRDEFVRRRQWLDDNHFADLVALCQFLPGPASSQLVYALGSQRGGFWGAVLASVCFTLPSAVLMIAFAYGIEIAGGLGSAAWLHGVKLAAVGVVAQAVWGMGRSILTTWPRAAMCAAAAAALWFVPGRATTALVIAGGALAGFVWFRTATTPSAPLEHMEGRGHRLGALALAVFLLLLLLLPLVASATSAPIVDVITGFYRAGSLVFGGGHVVLPLLEAEVVPRGWLSSDQFLAGYGAAQALPGPMFAFSAYLGTAMQPGDASWLRGLVCLLAIFLPAWLLVGGTLPFWQQLRSKVWAQAALAGANATVVGVLLAALARPVISESVHDPKDAVFAVACFAVLHWAKAPAWLLVAGMAAIAQLGFVG